MQYAKFDHFAIQAEKTFKQATLLRAKTAMLMMGRSSDKLRQHITRMIFFAWKKLKSEAAQNEVTMARLIKIKEMQTRTRFKLLTFRSWLSWTEACYEERDLKINFAMDRYKGDIITHS